MKTIEERAKEYAPGTFLSALERKAYFAGAKDQQYIDRLLIEQLIDKAWSLAYSMYQVGRDNLTPLTKDEFCKKNGGKVMKIYCIEIGEYDDEWQFVLKVDNDRIEVLHAMDGLDHDITDTVEVDEIEDFVKP